MSRSDKMKRLCIFAHFDKDNIVDEHVLFYLRDIRKVADRIVFVSTSTLSPETISMLNNICDSVISRNNEGYDFASWQTAIKSETLKDFDELILCNDSVYGPLFSLERVFSAMKGDSCDFWGITSSYDIAYHIQSYFLVFKKRVLDSSVFQKFWEGTNIPQSKREIIRVCEIGLSQTLFRAGFKASAYARYRNLVTYIIFYRLRSYLVRGCKSIHEYARSLLLCALRLCKIYVTTFLQKALAFISPYRQHRKNRIRRGLNTFITLALISAANIVSKMREIIRNGPSGIIDFIRHSKEGLRGLFSHFESVLKSTNVTHVLWKQLILNYTVPFIKVDLLRDNPMEMNIRDYPKIISTVSNYNIQMITSHLSRVKIVQDKNDKPS